jgi:NhaA family Na+:H+ antiporter
MKTKLTTLFIEFFQSEQSSGIVLLLNAILAILLANSPMNQAFLSFWHLPLGWDIGSLHLKHDLLHWVNDGLMAIFFLLIGLEIEREIYIGELSDLKNALLPIFAALGGMLVPALIHLSLNMGRPTQNGFGIPTATDIAFALGALSLLGSRVPAALKVFLTAFAIIDDLGAMMVIAFFYSDGFSWTYLLLALAVFGFLLLLNWWGVDRIAAYLIPGLLMWYLMGQSGIHASLSGVLLAFALPFRDGKPKTPSYRLQHALHKPAAFLIMPIFALANTGIIISAEVLRNAITTNTLGIFLGLLLGKPIGILLFSFAAIQARFAKLSSDIHYRDLLGLGFLGGIGFTMSIFITILAFGEGLVTQNSKIAILLGSISSAGIGLWILSRRPAASQKETL